MTWKGGGTDQARGEFQDELQLSHGLRANNFNLDRMLVSFKRRNPLPEQIQKNDSGAWEPWMKCGMTWPQSRSFCQYLVSGLLFKFIFIFNFWHSGSFLCPHPHLHGITVLAPPLDPDCPRSNCSSAASWLCELRQTQALASPASEYRFESSYLTEN